MYIVAWMLNGVSHSITFKNQMLATIKMIQLEQYGLEPTMHFKEL